MGRGKEEVEGEAIRKGQREGQALDHWCAKSTPTPNDFTLFASDLIVPNLDTRSPPNPLKIVNSTANNSTSSYVIEVRNPTKLFPIALIYYSQSNITSIHVTSSLQIKL